VSSNVMRDSVRTRDSSRKTTAEYASQCDAEESSPAHTNTIV
jgi:hypothetical protein